MACIRNCSGSPLCSALGLGCFQIIQDGGKGCTDLPEGYSVIQITATGDLEICSNIGGVCTCEQIAVGVGIDILAPNGDGTFTHTNVAGVPVTINICDLLTEASTVWTDIPLSVGWIASPGKQTPQYREVCGEVQLRGCVLHEDNDGDGAVPETIGTLPAGFRPPATVTFIGGGNCSAVEVELDGDIITDPSAPPFERCFDGEFFFTS